MQNPALSKYENGNGQQNGLHAVFNVSKLLSIDTKL